jgi:3-oxoacyl-[acyl-carrier-protein] synthase III
MSAAEPLAPTSAAPVYLSALAAAPGTGRPLAALAGMLPPAVLATLGSSGFTGYLASDRSAPELAAASLRRSLEVAGEPELAALVYATNSSEGNSATHDAFSLVEAVDRPTAPPVVLGGNGCGNLVPALRLAADWARSDGTSPVGVVTADRRADAARFEAFSGSVLSDGAASCLVGPVPYGDGFRLLGLATAARGRMPDAGSFLKNARTVRSGVHEALDRLGIRPGDVANEFRTLLVGNYSPSTRRFFAGMCGMPEGRVYAPRALETGHCFSADLLVGLGDLAREGALAPDDRLLLLATGAQSWSFASLTYVPTADHGAVEVLAGVTA